MRHSEFISESHYTDNQISMRTCISTTLNNLLLSGAEAKVDENEQTKQFFIDIEKSC